ncbi:MAG: hypothetical protein ACLUEK_08685 [Oscillospiraceae bacterium]
MLHFRKLSITDRAWAQPFIEAENSRSADYNFGNIYMWDGRSVSTCLGRRASLTSSLRGHALFRLPHRLRRRQALHRR